MEEVENLPRLLETSERLRKVLQYRREELLSINLYLFLLELRNLIGANPRLTFSDLVFEILLRLAQGLYMKSLLLLNPTAKGEEVEEGILEKLVSERQFHLFDRLPLDRVLEDKVFVAKVQMDDLSGSPSERGDLSKIISAIIEVFERLRSEPQLVLELNQESIDRVAEDLREVLLKRRVLTWRELIEEKEYHSKEALVFAFLALLFLVFEGFCGVHQDADNCIHIYLIT